MNLANKSAFIAAAVAFAFSGYLLVVGMKDRERLRILESQVEKLRDESGARENPAPSVEVPATPADPAIASAAKSLGEDAYDLSQSVDKLDRTLQTLDSRIVRSRLAVPDEKEREAQFERGRKRLEELRKAAAEARDKARQIAADLKLPFDEKRLLEPGANPALEEKPEFVAARDAAAAQQRVVESCKKKLTELHLSTGVEGLPPEGRPRRRDNSPVPRVRS